MNDESKQMPAPDGPEGSYVFIGAVVTEDLIEQIQRMPEVTTYTTNYDAVVWVDLKLCSGMYRYIWEDDKKYPEWVTREELEYDELYAQVTTAVACVDGEMQEYFRLGANSIKEGRNIQSGDCYKAVISSNLAERNNLKVGDIFRIELKEGMLPTAENILLTLGEPIDVEIIGLYEIHFEQEYSIYTPVSGYGENIIYTDWKTVNKIRSNGKMGKVKGYTDVSFFVEDPEKLDSVIEQIKSRTDMKELIIEPDDRAYGTSVRPLKWMNRIAIFMMIVGVGGCIVVLYLLLKMWSESRKREIGILLSAGITQKELQVQMLIECMILIGIASIMTFLISDTLTEWVLHMAENITAPRAGELVCDIKFESIQELPVISKNRSERMDLSYHLSLSTALFMILGMIGISACSVILSTKNFMCKSLRELL